MLSIGVKKGSQIEIQEFRNDEVKRVLTGAGMEGDKAEHSDYYSEFSRIIKEELSDCPGGLTKGERRAWLEAQLGAVASDPKALAVWKNVQKRKREDKK